MKILILAFTTSILFSACVSRDSFITDNTKRTPKENVDVFTNGNVPDKSYRTIGTLTQLGPIHEELRALKYFRKEAQKIGADGLIFEWPPKGEQRSAVILGSTGGIGGSSGVYNFRCDLIVYDTVGGILNK